MDFSELNDKFFILSQIFTAKQAGNGKTTFTMSEPRPTDAFLFFVNTEGICYQENSKPLYIPQGALVYMPKNSKYIRENSPAPGMNKQENILFKFVLNEVESWQTQGHKKNAQFREYR